MEAVDADMPSPPEDSDSELELEPEPEPDPELEPDSDVELHAMSVVRPVKSANTLVVPAPSTTGTPVAVSDGTPPAPAVNAPGCGGGPQNSDVGAFGSVRVAADVSTNRGDDGQAYMDDGEADRCCFVRDQPMDVENSMAGRVGDGGRRAPTRATGESWSNTSGMNRSHTGLRSSHSGRGGVARAGTRLRRRSRVTAAAAVALPDGRNTDRCGRRRVRLLSLP